MFGKKIDFQNKTVRTGLLSFTGAWLVLGILGLGNALSSYVFFRLDLTENRIYSLSPSSKKLLHELKEPVVIKGYFSNALTPPYSTYEEYVKDLLQEYVTYSSGKVKFSIVSAEDEAKFTEDARRAGISPVRFTQIARDKYETREGYLGLVLRYEDKMDAIPWIKDTAGLEYDITSRIKKLAFPSQKTVGFMNSNNCRNVLSEVPGLTDIVEKQYAVKQITLENLKPEELSVLFVIGPQSPFSAAQISGLDQALAHGLPTALFLDQQMVETQQFTPRPNNHGLNDWLKAKGMTIKPGFVLDMQNQQITIQSRQGIFTFANIVQYPLFPVVTNFDKNNPAVKDVEQATFPYPHPIEMSTTTAKVTILCQSSPKSWYKEGLFQLSPFIQFVPEPKDQQGPFPLATLLEGEWGGPKTRLAVVGTSRVLDSGLPISQTNFSLFLNLLDYLAQDESLIAIRSKGNTYRPLRDLSAGKRMAVKYTDMLAMPLLVTAGGVIRWRRRKTKKKALAAEFQRVA